SPPTTWRLGWPGTTRNWPVTSYSGPGRSSSSKESPPTTCSRLGKRTVPVSSEPSFRPHAEMKLSYVLPLLRRPGEGGLDELTDYMYRLSRRVEVIVADGSSPELQRLHESLWPDVVHVAVTNRPRRYG